MSELIILFILLVIVQAITTGWAMWIAARRKSKGWFIFFLLVHTIIIETIYIVKNKDKI